MGVMCQKKTAIASEGPDAISLGVSACAAIDRLDNSWLHSGPICQRKGKAETPTRAVLQLVSASGHATGIDSDKGQSFPTDPSAPPSPAQVLPAAFRPRMLCGRGRVCVSALLRQQRQARA